MGSANSLISRIDLYTAAHGGMASHPKLNPNHQQPFTLLKAPDGSYVLTFINNLESQVRVYVKGFSTSQNAPLWFTTRAVDRKHHPHNTHHYVSFTPSDLNGATKIWVGCWWDDDTYPATSTGIEAYFTAHPEGGEHHTVPILVG